MSQTQPVVVQAPMRLGRYELLRRLAVGGMAELFLARATGIEGFEKIVVLKRILPHSAGDEEFVRMFLTEARLAAALGHPNIVHVYDIGREDQDYFFTMEYLHGEDVRYILATLRARGKRLALSHALTVVAGVAAGLHFAHEQIGYDGRRLGIVHRDVSPSNVIVTYGGGVKLVDFGIAKAADRTNLSRLSTLKGKAAYMSPEQARSGRVDRRSDIFALGLLAQELITMQPVFGEGNELSMMHRVAAADTPAPADVWPQCPPALARIIERALEREPDDRFQTALEMRQQIERFAFEARVPLSTADLNAFLLDEFGPKPYPWAGTEPPTPEPKRRGLSRTRDFSGDEDEDDGESAPDLRARRTAMRTRILGEPPPALSDDRRRRPRLTPLRFEALPTEDYDDETNLTERVGELSDPAGPSATEPARRSGAAPPRGRGISVALGIAALVGVAGAAGGIWALRTDDRAAQTRGAPAPFHAPAAGHHTPPDAAVPAGSAAPGPAAPAEPAAPADAAAPSGVAPSPGPPGGVEPRDAAAGADAPDASATAAAPPPAEPSQPAADRRQPDHASSGRGKGRKRRQRRRTDPEAAPPAEPPPKPERDPNSLLPY